MSLRSPSLERHSLYRAACKASAEAGSAAIKRVALDSEGAERARSDAVSRWNQVEWWRWAAHRVIEHVRGEVFWIELGRTSFASVTGENPARGKVIDRIHQLESQLEDKALADFERRRRVAHEWMELINKLLDG